VRASRSPCDLVLAPRRLVAVRLIRLSLRSPLLAPGRRGASRRPYLRCPLWARPLSGRRDRRRRGVRRSDRAARPRCRPRGVGSTGRDGRGRLRSPTRRPSPPCKQGSSASRSCVPSSAVSRRLCSRARCGSCDAPRPHAPARYPRIAAVHTNSGVASRSSSLRGHSSGHRGKSDHFHRSRHAGVRFDIRGLGVLHASSPSPMRPIEGSRKASRTASRWRSIGHHQNHSTILFSGLFEHHSVSTITWQ
jgi:hypothetical protein